MRSRHSSSFAKYAFAVGVFSTASRIILMESSNSRSSAKHGAESAAVATINAEAINWGGDVFIFISNVSWLSKGCLFCNRENNRCVLLEMIGTAVFLLPFVGVQGVGECRFQPKAAIAISSFNKFVIRTLLAERVPYLF